MTPPTKPALRTCETCLYHNSDTLYCHRYPVPHPATLHHYCGEHYHVLPQLPDIASQILATIREDAERNRFLAHKHPKRKAIAVHLDLLLSQLDDLVRRNS